MNWQSFMCGQLLRVPILRELLFVLFLLSANSAARSDDYFNRALDKIEATLVHPVNDYGLSVLDSYDYTDSPATVLAELGHIKEGFGLYTLGGKVRWTHDTFDTNNPQKGIYSHQIFVSLGEALKGETMDTSEGKNVLSTNSDRSALSIGQEEIYVWHPSAQENVESPNRQPIQILTNPCFTNLNIAPSELRQLSTEMRSDETGNKVYEVQRKKYDDTEYISFYFDPEHGDALVKTDVKIGKEASNGEIKFHTHIVRAVESWQKAPDGTFVPARFTMDRICEGRREVRLVREINNPVIGTVNDELFDIGKIAEFQVKPDRVLDMSTLRSALQGPR